MRDEWQVLPLGVLCDVLDHKRKPITKRDREAGEYPYYGATGVLDHVAGYLFDEPRRRPMEWCNSGGSAPA
jgi:hypothetical protein